MVRFPFKTFRIDSHDVEDLGIVGAMNEGFKRIFRWQTRTTGDGILQITKPWSDIGAVADVLEKLIKENPNSDGSPDGVLMKWVEDITNGCIKAIRDAGQGLPDPPAKSCQKRKHIDVNIDAAILREVVPKETTSACHSSRPPAIIAGILALDTPEELDSASGNAADSGDFDWEAL
uniref:Uncharacterized protein n=1 Tax=Moniliophthora roreri TaxID=221103 RepID=A0A0W0FS12_MONRR